nr:protein tyrosine phosphatase n9 [Hymenolepis microstoma]
MNLCGRNGETVPQKPSSQFSLSPKEKECIENFLGSVGTSLIADNDAQACRFLAARKFNVKEAVDLFHSYEAFLKSEGITLINPFEESVRRELLSGKFTILNDSDQAGARVAQFFVRLHRPAKSTHKAFLQSVIFQLSAALRKETAARNGIILIYDMTNSKYSNFDADLSKKLFNMLKSCFPIRLRRIIVLTAPLWFRAPFQLLRVFIKEELRDRVHVMRPSPGSRLASLSNPDPAVARRDHFAWLNAAITETAPFATTNPSELLYSTNLGLAASRQPVTIATFFNISSSNGTDSSTNTLDRSGCSSSSVSDTGGDIDAGGVPLGDDESLMAEIGCCSPNWDPFALSSSQSSDAESVNNDGSLEGSSRKNIMSMSCSPVLSAANIAGAASLTNGDILLYSTNLGLAASRQPVTIATFFNISSSNGTDSSTNTLDRSGCSSSSVSDTGGDIDAGGVPLGDDESLMAEIGCCSPNWDPFALSSSQSSDAESVNNDGSLEGSSRKNIMSMSCSPVLSAANIAGAASLTNGDISKDQPQGAKTVTEGTPTPPAKPKFPTSCLPFNNMQSVNDPTSATTPKSARLASSAAVLVGQGVKSGSVLSLHNYLNSSTDSSGKKAPLASQDDLTSLIMMAAEDSDTIRKEKRSKQAANSSTSLSSTSSHSLGSKSGLHPSDLIPFWAVDRPSGPSIHEGPNIPNTSSAASASHHHSSEDNDSQSDKFFCAGEPSPAPTVSSPFPLRSRILQFHEPTSQVNDLVKYSINDHQDEESGHCQEIEQEGQAMEVDCEQEEEEGNCDSDDDVNDDGNGSQSERSGSEDDNDEPMDLDLDNLWMTPDQLVNHVVDVGVNGLFEEYSAIGNIKTNDPCTAFRRPCNSSKNRYVDVTCLEHSRVQLRSHRQNPTTTLNTGSGLATSGKSVSRADKQVPIYIHANWVDSYRQRNAFICTQGPLQDTSGDFWFMIWTYNVPAIVMITRCYESQRCKCFQYWPAIEGQSLRFTTVSPNATSVVTTGSSGWGGIGATGGPANSGTMAPSKKKTLYGLTRRSASEISNSNKFVFEVTHLSSQPGEDYTCTKLQLKDIKSGQSRIIEHYAFHSWPDHGVPSDSSALLELLSTVQNEYASIIKRELGYDSSFDTPIPPPPIVVHCSAGIGRTGTFIALDVSTKQLLELGKVNVPLTVARIRSQRSGCVQVSAQYLFVYRALIDFALARGLISPSSSNAATVAQRQLSASTRPSMPSVGPTGSIPMDASLLSVLAAASQQSGSGSTSSGSSDTDTAHFGALMRLVRGYMTSVRGGVDGNVNANSQQQRISTELDYETEETQTFPMAESEEDDEVEGIDATCDEGGPNSSEEPKLAEISTEEEEETDAMQTEELAPQIPSSSPPSGIPHTISNCNQEQQQTVIVEKSAAFY